MNDKERKKNIVCACIILRTFIRPHVIHLFNNHPHQKDKDTQSKKKTITTNFIIVYFIIAILYIVLYI